MNIFGPDKYDRILQRKPYKPGKGPRTRPGKPSEYAGQLEEKQKLRDIFGISEKQCRRIFAEAQRRKEATGAAMLKIVECRLDNAVYRAGLALTRLQARQMVTHGVFLVNDSRTDTPSRLVVPGDRIRIRDRSKNSPLFAMIMSATEKYLPPAWIKVSSNSFEFEIVALPEEEHFEQGIDIQKIVELYSR